MRIGLYHGYELSGSGSNEYTRYLAASLAEAGHELHVVCREPQPAALAGVDAAVAWDLPGGPEVLFGEPGRPGTVTVHRLPHSHVRPVYVADKQRSGYVKVFVDLTDAELADLRSSYAQSLRDVLQAFPVDILHANHLVLQPTIAKDVCPDLGIPFVIYPHGSEIEYTVRRDSRYLELGREALAAAAGVIPGSVEMRERLLSLYPDMADVLLGRSEVIGVGVDTSRFQPVDRLKRDDTITELIRDLPCDGKPAALSTQLRRQLDSGDLSAVTSYRSAYAADEADEDAADTLRAVPWESGRVVLYVGALTVGKGVQSLIAAWPAVMAAAPDAHLVIVGSGSYREVLEGLVHSLATGNENLLDHLVMHGMELEAGHLEGGWPDVASYLSDPVNRRLVMSAQPGIAERIHFLGRLEHDHLRLLFPCCDLAVFPSVVPEAYPLVLMESMSCGVLPAASDTAGLGDGLTQLEPLLGTDLVERLRLPVATDERVTGIASRIVSLLTDDSVLDLGPRLRTIAEQEYDWRFRAAAMHHAYSRFAADL